MESEVYLALHVCLSALSKPLLIRKSVNVKQIAHHTKSLACRESVFSCVEVITPQVTKYIELEGVGAQ